MTKSNEEIVLITGGSGFLGQHIIKLLLQEKDNLGIKEIRSIDLQPYTNEIGHPKSKDLITYIGDVCKPETLEMAFNGASTVFHCAGIVSIQYPPDYDELERVNVDGTRNVIEMCVKHNVERLIYTSCASVAFTPFKGQGTFSVVINQTESSVSSPVHDPNRPLNDFDKSFLIPGYSSSKLRAENIVLNSNETLLENRTDYLQTAAVRPPLIYGECDNHFMPAVLKYLAKRNNIIPRIAGAGGKQQLVYAGNAAWGHICTYKTLKTNPRKIRGLAAFITDDTPINDIARFIQRIGRTSKHLKFKTSLWSIPHFMFFFLAFIIEMMVKLLYPVTKFKLNYSLRVLSSFTASVIMYNRLRASIHLDYEPIFDENKSFELSTEWYEKWYGEHIGFRDIKTLKDKDT